MGATVVAGVESALELEAPGTNPNASVRLRLLGNLEVIRHGESLRLPPSRKVRALIAYLVLSPHPLSRERLCELLWDIPNDPRGELRWCLSKARMLLDEPEHRCVDTTAGNVWLSLGNCYVDAIDVDRCVQQGLGRLQTRHLEGLLARFAGDFLEGLEIGRNPSFNSWLTGQRHRFRAYRIALLEELVERMPAASRESLAYLDAWMGLAPFDRRAHELVLLALARRGQLKEGDEHLAATARAFESEGLDWLPLRNTWREAKAAFSITSAVPGLASPALAGGSQSVEAGRPATGRRASIAVMPFRDRAAGGGVRGGLADGLAHDIITRLAKMRSLFVIAQGTVFALDQRSMGAEEAGRTLNVDYVVSGTLLRTSTRITVDVQLVESRTSRIVWTDVFDHRLDDAFLALDEIGNQIVASVDVEVEAAERNRAILKPPSSLDAWEAHHRGLWHMYRFNRTDNELAQHFFEMAVRLDPTFARAYAGLSFTHWQNAFQNWERRELEIDRAFEAAGQSLVVDERDPAAHWAMGRAQWLRGNVEQSLMELRSAVDLSANFALGHYTLGFVNCQSGDADAAIVSSDYSRHLSPFDPLLFGMLAVRAIALLRLGREEEAADWAVRAAARPNAHLHIVAIAAQCLGMVDRLEEAQVLLAQIRKVQPEYRVDDFLGAFQFSQDAITQFRAGAKRIGFR